MPGELGQLWPPYDNKIFGFHASINVEPISSALIKIKGVRQEHNVASGSFAADLKRPHRLPMVASL